LKVTD